jgi:hypothetical protein
MALLSGGCLFQCIAADEVDAMDVRFDWKGRSSKHIPFDWTGP